MVSDFRYSILILIAIVTSKSTWLDIKNMWLYLSTRIWYRREKFQSTQVFDFRPKLHGSWINQVDGYLAVDISWFDTPIVCTTAITGTRSALLYVLQNIRKWNWFVVVPSFILQMLWYCSWYECVQDAVSNLHQLTFKKLTTETLLLYAM